MDMRRPSSVWSCSLSSSLCVTGLTLGRGTCPRTTNRSVRMQRLKRPLRQPQRNETKSRHLAFALSTKSGGFLKRRIVKYRLIGITWPFQRHRFSYGIQASKTSVDAIGIRTFSQAPLQPKDRVSNGKSQEPEEITGKIFLAHMLQGRLQFLKPRLSVCGKQKSSKTAGVERAHDSVILLAGARERQTFHCWRTRETAHVGGQPYNRSATGYLWMSHLVIT